MKDIVKEIREAEVNGGWNGREKYFRKESMIARDYFINELLEKYSNLEFIRIYMRRSEWKYTYGDSYCESEYYFFSVFINKNVFEYLSNDVLVLEKDGKKVIDLTNFNWNKQLELRNKILKSCPILLAESSYWSSEMVEQDEHLYRAYGIPKKDYTSLSDVISLYPHNYTIDGYEILNSTNYILISNSGMINQKELDDLCLDILENLSEDNEKFVNSEKVIYLSISEKLKRSRSLTEEERKLLGKFINNEINKIEQQNTLLVRSRIRK